MVFLGLVMVVINQINNIQRKGDYIAIKKKKKKKELQ